MATSVATKIAELEKIYDEISKKNLTIDLPSADDLIKKGTAEDMYYTAEDMYYKVILPKVKEGFESYFKPIIKISTKSKSLRKWSQLVEDNVSKPSCLLPITVMCTECRRFIDEKRTPYKENEFIAKDRLLGECRLIDDALFKGANAQKCISRLQRSSFTESFNKKNEQIKKNIIKIENECREVMKTTFESIKDTMKNIFKQKQSGNTNDQWIFKIDS